MSTIAIAPSQTNLNTETFIAILSKRDDPALIPELESSAYWYATAGKAALIFSSAIPLIAVIATAASAAPVYLFIVIPAGLLTVGLGALAYGIFKVTVADEKQSHAERLKQLAPMQQRFANATPLDLQEALREREIDWIQIPGMRDHPDHLAQLKPVLAYDCHLKEMIRSTERDSQVLQGYGQVIAEGSNGTPDDSTARDIANARQIALKGEKLALFLKISRGFLHAVMRNPTYRGDMEDLGEENELAQPMDHYTAQAAGAQDISLFTFKNRAIAPLTYGEVQSSTATRLGERFCAAMAASTA